MLDDASKAWLAAINDGNLERADQLRRVLDTADTLDRQARARREAEPTYLLQAARDYATEGIRVFPVRPGGKTPLTANGFKDATTNPDLIMTWWTTWPKANIGLPTGHQFDVIDVDGRDGVISIWGGQEAFIDTLTVIGHAMTSRDAGHHLYIPPQGRGNGAAIFPGIDYRGLGGYVVAPPSIGESGRRYTWAHPLVIA